MRFELSKRVTTNAAGQAVLDFAEQQMRNIARSVTLVDGVIRAESVEASFGSINRSDETIVTIKSADGGYLIVSETTYTPSFFFWIFFIAALFTYVGWVVPMVFYFHQRGTVKSAIESAMNRIADEFTASAPPPAPLGHIEALKSLAELKANGALTEEEFQREKERLLNR